jgi:hypothetical protein
MHETIIHETFADVGLWWRWLALTTRAVRSEWNNPTIGEHFERLAGRMDEIDREQGIPAPDANGLVSSSLAANLEAIRAGEELRAVIVRPMSSPGLSAEPSIADVLEANSTSAHETPPLLVEPG